jgi:hypothetical protein
MSEDEEIPIDYKELRKIRNLSNPKGDKIQMYEE